MKKQAILVVSFGTSHTATREKTIGALEKTLAESFPDRTFYRAWTSKVIIKKLRASGEKILTVEEALQKAYEDGVKDLLVQPTHIIPGQEYQLLREMLKVNESKFDTIRLGKPLLSSDHDYRETAELMAKLYPKEEGTLTILMGHGTERGDNTPYLEVRRYLKELQPSVLMGLVEANPDINDILEELKEQTAAKKLRLAPFLIVAGDHAVRDMAGEEEDSWKNILGRAGYQVECVLKGLGEYPEVRQLYVERAKEAEALSAD